MKVLVPPAPVDSCVEKTKREKSQQRSHVTSGLVEAFDAGFVSRIIASMLGLGALLMLGVLGASNSPLIAGSFFGGVVLGALLLKSQELFVRKVLGPRATNEKSLWGRAPLAVILPLKYILVGAVLGIAIEQSWLVPPALAAGFIVGQIVIVAKVVGRFAALKMRANETRFDYVA